MPTAVTMIVRCPHCYLKVALTSDGRCPSCTREVTEEDLRMDDARVLELFEGDPPPEGCMLCGAPGSRLVLFTASDVDRSVTTSDPESSRPFLRRLGAGVFMGIVAFLTAGASSAEQVARMVCPEGELRIYLRSCEECHPLCLRLRPDVVDLGRRRMRFVFR